MVDNNQNLNNTQQASAPAGNNTLDQKLCRDLHYCKDSEPGLVEDENKDKFRPLDKLWDYVFK